jgi:hypothetical protein
MTIGKTLAAWRLRLAARLLNLPACSHLYLHRTPAGNVIAVEGLPKGTVRPWQTLPADVPPSWMVYTREGCYHVPLFDIVELTVRPLAEAEGG